MLLRRRRAGEPGVQCGWHSELRHGVQPLSGCRLQLYDGPRPLLRGSEYPRRAERQRRLLGSEGPALRDRGLRRFRPPSLRLARPGRLRDIRMRLRRDDPCQMRLRVGALVASWAVYVGRREQRRAGTVRLPFDLAHDPRSRGGCRALREVTDHVAASACLIKFARMPSSVRESFLFITRLSMSQPTGPNFIE